MAPHIRSHGAPCSCFPKKVFLQLTSEQSVGDVCVWLQRVLVLSQCKLLDICSDHTRRQLHCLLATPGARHVISQLYAEFTRYHKYSHRAESC